MPFARKATLVILILLQIVGCSTRPSYVLSRKEMKAVSKDMFLADAYLSYQNPPDSIWLQYHLKILSEHNVSPSVYDSSLAWYGRHPDFLTSIHNEIIEELKAEKGVLDQSLQDSLDIRRLRMVKVSDLLPQGSLRRLYIPSTYRYYTHHYLIDNRSVMGDDSILIDLRLLTKRYENLRLYTSVVLLDSDKGQFFFREDTAQISKSILFFSLPLPDSIPSSADVILRFTVTSPSSAGYPILLDSIRVQTPRMRREHQGSLSTADSLLTPSTPKHSQTVNSSPETNV